ncbi:S-layer homology domain-containing protein [Paenibacillus glacialis]|nr:S-layer homology domain-containing protein [Paenibacillus glacialis]
MNTNFVKNSKFKDVLGHWAEAEIDTLSDMGIIKGTTDGLFKPNANATRSESLLLILRMLNASLDHSLDVE